MPYSGYGGQEIEDPELDDMRREAQTMNGAGADPHTARQDELEARIERLEARLARLETFAESLDDAGCVTTQAVTALEAKLETVSESLVRHQDNEGRHAR